MRNIAANLLVFKDAEAASGETAQRFICGALNAAARGESFFAAIPGGETPRRCFELLARPDLARVVPWDRVHIFFTDERCVPPDHRDSNYRQANELLLSQVPIPDSHVHRFLAETEPTLAAYRYEEEMRQEMGENPRFDLILLGMGGETHTASLFPHSPALHEESRLAVPNYVEKLRSYRLTLTYPVLNAARAVIVLVVGPEKAEALRLALRGEVNPEVHPVQGIQPTDGDLLWIVDRAAASGLIVG